MDACRSGHPVVTLDQFLDFVGHLLPQEPYLDLPRITERDLQEVARAKKSTAGGLDGWAWNEIKALPLPCFSGLAFLSELVETTGVWPQGLLDAYIAMIPKADGDSTLPGQRPLSVLPVVYRLWASLRLGHLREWVEGWVPTSVFSLGNGLSLVEVWFSTAIDIEEVLSWTGRDQLHVMVADVIKSFDTVDRSILVCALGRLGLPDWFRRVYFSFLSQVRLRFKLAAGLGESWCIPQGCPLSMAFDTVDRSILVCALGRLGLPDWFRKVYFSFHSQVRLRFKLADGLGEPWCRDGGIPSGSSL